MAHCPECGEEISPRAQFCPRCGAPQHQERQSSAQLPLPGMPVLQPAGAGAAVPAASETAAPGRPLTVPQVAVAVGAVLLLLLGIVFFAGHRPMSDSSTHAKVPVLGAVGEPVSIGKTAVGVADTGSADTWEGRPPKNGQFIGVIIIVANNGTDAFMLDDAAFALTDGRNDGRHAPAFIAYGMPEELQAGKYQRTYQLKPGELIAAVAVFDIAKTDTQPRLLVRDMTQSDKAFTGAIDLTQKTRQQNGTQRPGSGVLPLKGWKNGRIEEWKNRRVEEWKSGRMEEWKDEWVDE